MSQITQDNLDAANSELSRASVELSAITDAASTPGAVDPIELGTARAKYELAQLAKDAAETAHAAAQRTEAADAANRYLDGIRSQLDPAEAKVREALETMRLAADDLAHAIRNHTTTASNIAQTAAGLHVDRVRSLPSGAVSVDGRPVRSLAKGAAVEVLRITAPLVQLAPDLSGVGQQMATNAATQNALPPKA